MRGDEVAREVDTLLGVAADAEARLDDVVRLLVPQLAGAAVIHLLDGQGHLVPAAVAHRDAPAEAALHDQAADEQGPLQPLLWEALRAGTPRVIEAPNGVVAPLLSVRGRLGTLTLLFEAARRATPADTDTVRRIASRIALAIDYARALREAAAAGKAKSDFLALMSHELKTPLNIILGYADLLIRGVPDPLPHTAVRQVERLRGGALHLLALVDEVLTLARLEAGEERVHRADVDVHALLSEVVGIAGELAADRRLRFSSPDARDRVVLRTDPLKLRQILLELLTNAVKFTPEGEVTVELATSPATLTLTVRDTGMGMAPEEVQQAFDAFWQGDRSMTRRSGGSGLGLAVASRLTRLLGGTLVLTSEPGRGTTAKLELPWEATTPPS